MAKSFEIIDLFAGPGGLGEGFSAAGRETGTTMKIRMSVEKQPTEVRTLRLRSFLRSFGDQFPGAYHDALNRGQPLPDWSETHPAAWKAAKDEARGLTLGGVGVFDEIATVLDETRERNHGDTILIGGPPCQAYSIVGRSRNKGIEGYVPEQDHRHFLYQEYVGILQRLRPAVFVMENVKGMLSSKVGGGEIFERVLTDLRNAGDGYTLVPLAVDRLGVEARGRDYVVRSEEHGIPQARHRVLILGLRSDLPALPPGPALLPTVDHRISVKQVISDLPRLRSGLSYGDSSSAWLRVVENHIAAIAGADAVPSEVRALVATTNASLKGSIEDRSSSGPRLPIDMPRHLADWLLDPQLDVVLNHETRSHIQEDLGRYLFVAAYGKVFGRSPGLRDFPEFLLPDHKSKNTGAFADRFRVQIGIRPSTTITSHISKDGHYYIHPDETQVRSLTVREAARLQTFPDNYYFHGGRTAQYHQVGNAVPPYLAYQIGRVVREILSR